LGWQVERGRGSVSGLGSDKERVGKKGREIMEGDAR